MINALSLSNFLFIFILPMVFFDLTIKFFKLFRTLGKLDPDPMGSLDPDPGGQKWPRKIENGL
jgi:hypothetical protein